MVIQLSLTLSLECFCFVDLHGRGRLANFEIIFGQNQFCSNGFDCHRVRHRRSDVAGARLVGAHDDTNRIIPEKLGRELESTHFKRCWIDDQAVIGGAAESNQHHVELQIKAFDDEGPLILQLVNVVHAHGDVVRLHIGTTDRKNGRVETKLS